MTGSTRSTGLALLAAAAASIAIPPARAADGISTLILQGQGECQLEQYGYGHLNIGEILQVPLYPGGPAVTVQFPPWFLESEVDILPPGERSIRFSIESVLLQGCVQYPCDGAQWKPACTGTTYEWDTAAPGTLTFGPPDPQSRTCACTPGGALQPE